MDKNCCYRCGLTKKEAYSEKIGCEVPGTTYKQHMWPKAHEQEEWGAWKIVSDMLDHPDENGIYPTSKCYQELYDFVVAQKKKAFAAGEEHAIRLMQHQARNVFKSAKAVAEWGDTYLALKDDEL